jgi:dihydropyrimidinase
MDLLIKNGTIVTASDTFLADLAIENGRVVQIGQSIAAGPGARVVDAAGQLVLPGGVDAHTHLDVAAQGSHTADDWRTGTVAAACGGTTALVDFCSQERGHSLHDAIAKWDGNAAGKAAIDYGYHMIVLDMTDRVYQELAELPELGITSFKIFMAYKYANMVDDWTLARALEQSRKHGALVIVHAENGDLAYLLQRRLLAEGKTGPASHPLSRPPRVEAEATARAIAMAEVIGAPVFIVHMSCGESIEELIRGRARGVAVFGETCPQYLYLNDDVFAKLGFEGAKYVFTPPPRAKHQSERVWQALADGTLQSIGSDHSPFNFKGQKEIGRDDFTKIPNGAPGIEERLMTVYQGVNAGRISLNRFVDLVATTPAKIFGLHPAKGTIAVGSDADLAIWDPLAELTLTQSVLHHAVDYTAYEGMKIRGVPKTVLLRGNVIVKNREYVGQPGSGRFLRRKRFDPASVG